ncbi:MAG TPA: hypothetical protein VLK65_14790 [Vicinamibacteria bacterium]|nr:hypothetical protein [Vicinamibacteria bacterium]
MDRRERELEPGGTRRDLASDGRALSKTTDLLNQGDHLYAAGFFQRAVHVWTRILFVDRGNQVVRARIKRAKEALAERQRQLDSQVAEAGRLLARGDVDGASQSVRAALALDSRNAEALRLSEMIATTGRRPTARPEANAGSHGVENVPSRGLLLRVTRTKDRIGIKHSAVASPLKMTAFILFVSVLFAAGALLLYMNWESIVSDGVGASTAATATSGSQWRAPVPPGLAELRYYNGVRLFEQGRYREALAELGRVDRESKVAAEARGLILRIEERLLRAAPDPLGDDGRAPAGTR